jgi:hypothetical protein
MTPWFDMAVQHARDAFPIRERNEALYIQAIRQQWQDELGVTAETSGMGPLDVEAEGPSSRLDTKELR